MFERPDWVVGVLGQRARWTRRRERGIITTHGYEAGPPEHLMARRVTRNAAVWPPVVSLGLGVILHSILHETTPVADASTYDSIASGLVGVSHINFVNLHWAVGGLGMRGYVYPILIAALYALAGH